MKPALVMKYDQMQPDQKQQILASARATIAQEVAGLTALSDTLNGDFCALVSRILTMKGRVVLTGMGKSGHVAKKIAATMASTGTPAFFVHPSEASHGDLGMITEGDVVVALSNSGETAELRDIISYTRRFGIFLAAFVRRKQSMLVEAADVALVLPAIPEAGGTDAPTTSTTMMLALGDALAMALSDLRGFGKEDFSVFHPGGKLGQNFLLVETLMHSGDELPLVRMNTPMSDVLIVMTEKRFGCAGVVDEDGRLLGVITDGDLRRHMSGNLLERNAGEVMTKSALSVAPRQLAAQALKIMNDRKVTALFALESGRPMGILHVHDCLRAGIV